MYKIIDDSSVFRTADNTCIPFVADNSDYVGYLLWLAEGNTPAPADLPSINQQVAEVKIEAQRIIYAKWPLWAQQNCNDGTYSPADKELMIADKTLVLTECTRLVTAIEAGQAAIPNWPTI